MSAFQPPSIAFAQLSPSRLAGLEVSGSGVLTEPLTSTSEEIPVPSVIGVAAPSRFTQLSPSTLAGLEISGSGVLKEPLASTSVEIPIPSVIGVPAGPSHEKSNVFQHLFEKIGVPSRSFSLETQTALGSVSFE